MSGIISQSLLHTNNTFSGAQIFDGQVMLAAQSASAGDSAMTRDLVDLRTLPFPTSAIGGLPTYRFFDDFISQSDISDLWLWSLAGGSSGFGRQADIASNTSRAFGVAEVVANANATYTRVFYNTSSPSNLPGLRMEAVLAIPDPTSMSCNIGVTGGGGAFIIVFDSAKYSGSWFIYDTDGGELNTAVAATAGDFKSGERWRIIAERLSTTATSVILEKAAWNSGSWTRVYSNIFSHLASMGRSMPMGPQLGVTSTTAAARSMRVDYVAYSHSMKR